MLSKPFLLEKHFPIFSSTGYVRARQFLTNIAKMERSVWIKSAIDISPILKTGSTSRLSSFRVPITTRSRILIKIINENIRDDWGRVRLDMIKKKAVSRKTRPHIRWSNFKITFKLSGAQNKSSVNNAQKQKGSKNELTKKEHVLKLNIKTK